MSSEKVHGCCEKVPGVGGWHFHNCSHKGKYLHDGKYYCGIHHPDKVKKRANEAQHKFNIEQEQQRLKWHKQGMFDEMLAALKEANLAIACSEFKGLNRKLSELISKAERR